MLPSPKYIQSLDTRGKSAVCSRERSGISIGTHSNLRRQRCRTLRIAFPRPISIFAAERWQKYRSHVEITTNTCPHEFGRFEDKISEVILSRIYLHVFFGSFCWLKTFQRRRNTPGQKWALRVSIDHQLTTLVSCFLPSGDLLAQVDLSKTQYLWFLSCCQLGCPYLLDPITRLIQSGRYGISYLYLVWRFWAVFTSSLPQDWSNK